MIAISIQSPGHVADRLFIIVSKVNLDRMAAADPVVVNLARCGYMLVNPEITFCHEEEHPELTRLLHEKNLAAIYDYLTRGWQGRPDLGDGQPYSRFSDGG